MPKFTFILILLLISCSEVSNSDPITLFDLNSHLERIGDDWSGKQLEKIYQSGGSEPERMLIASGEFQDMLSLFNPYDINKPDYADRFILKETSLDSGGVSTYLALDKDLKIRSFILYGAIATPDSIKIHYRHESLIGNSQHYISINASGISLKREEKYFMSDSLVSLLRIRPTP